MRFRTFTLGGCQLVMMGHHTRSESLFYYFRLEDHVPEDHLLRLIDKHVDLGFVRDRLKHHYSDTGRPSIDPELLLRILLIGYLYGITSERRLVEEVRMHLAYRWFTGLELIKRCHTILRSPRTVTAVSRKPTSSVSCSKRLWHAAWKSAW